MMHTETAIHRSEPLKSRTNALTLWDLVAAVEEVADNDLEVAATVAHLLSTGQISIGDAPARLTA